MNLIYKKVKRYKFFLKNINNPCNYALARIKYGFFGLQALTTCLVTYKQINTVRVLLSRNLKTIPGLVYRIYVRVFFTYGLTKKPALTRMGKGSGPIKQ